MAGKPLTKKEIEARIDLIMPFLSDEQKKILIEDVLGYSSLEKTTNKNNFFVSLNNKTDC